jgi:hypothetical protein
VLGRREDPRPPVELWGAPAEDAPSQRVAVEGLRPRRWHGALAVAVVAALLGAGLALGGDDDDSGGAQAVEPGERDNSAKLPLKATTTTTTRVQRSTTTTQPPPPVPILPGSGTRVVVTGAGGVELLDLDTGEAIELVVPRSVYGIVAVAGGVVLLDDGDARYLPLPRGGSPGEVVLLGPGDQAFPVGDGRAVWLTGVRSDGGDGASATLVDLDGNTIAGPVDLGGWVAGAHPRGLIVQAAGRVYVVDDRGAVIPVTTGEVLGVSEGWMLVRSCDDGLECGPELWGPDLGAPRRLPATRVAFGFGGALSVDPAGERAAFLLDGPRGQSVGIVDLDTGVAEAVEVGPTGVAGFGWLPGDLGVLVAQQFQLSRVHERDGRLRADQLRDRGADQLVILLG